MDSNSSETQLLRENRSGCLWLTLNRPELHNAFGDRLIAELTQALSAARDDPGIRAIVLTGSGKTFSAGADMNWMRGMVEAGEEENHADALRLAELLRTLNFHPKPTIARINGAAFGGGLGLIACCDITVAVADAVFAFTEVKLGLVPAVISPYVLRRLGERNARRYFLNAERFDAPRALRMGLVHEVVTPEALDDAVERQFRWLSQCGPQAVAEAKSLIFEVTGKDATRQEQLDSKTADIIARLRVSAEGQEGLNAFLEKRKTSWCGGDD